MKQLLFFATLVVACFSTHAQVITTIAGNGTAGYSGDGGAATAASLYYPRGVAVDASGNVYIADKANHRIRKVNTSGVINTIAGNGSYGYSGDGGAATAARLYSPLGVAVDASGNVYIADRDNHRIRKVNTSGVISTIAGNGSYGYSGDGGAATAARLASPASVAVDASGNVYIADNSNNRIRKVNTSGVISTIAGNGSYGYSGDGGAATAARLNGPTGIAVDASGNVYFADSSNHCIRKVNTSGIISTIAGNGSYGYSGDGGAATAASLYTPTGVAVDASGNVYIADYYNSRIRKVNTSGVITTIAGNGSYGYSGDGGAAAAASISYPTGVAVDASGNVYIADWYNDRIRMVNNCMLPVIASISGASFVNVGATVTLTDSTAGGTWTSSNTSQATVNSSGVVTGVSAGAVTITYTVTNSCGYNYAIKNLTITYISSGSASGIITTIAGNGGAYYSGDGGAATAASLNYPQGVAVDASGNVYIADHYNSRIRKVNTSGVITTIAGNGSYGYSGDGGAATAASLTTGGVAVDASGNVYIADYYNYRIRKVNTSGVISTIAGNGSSSSYGYLGDGGAATAASLRPSGVAVDASGNVYIADTGNNRIRKVNTSGIITTIAGNGSYGFSGDGGAATAASLRSPNGVAVDASGNVYIADIYNSRIRKVNTSGVINTIAGGGSGGDGGAATAASLSTPTGVAVDTSGNVYIAEHYNYRIRKVNTSGVITTIAGNGSYGYSGDGGAATAASLTNPFGVAVDASGNVYIAAGNRIRKVTFSSTGGGGTTTRRTCFLRADPNRFNTCPNLQKGLKDILATTARDAGVSLSYTLIGAPAHGTAVMPSSVTSTGSTIYPTGGYYRPDSGFTGIDSFWVTLSSGGTVYDTITLIAMVNPNPATPSVSGATTVCLGRGSITLTGTPSGGRWYRVTSALTVNNTTGEVMGNNPGMQRVRYSSPANSYGCRADAYYMVNVVRPLTMLPGASTLCPGATLSLAIPSGGSWSSTNTSIATGSGNTAIGVSSGVAALTYNFTDSICGTLALAKTYTVTAPPTVNPVSGTTSPIRVGRTTTFHNASPSGMWSSSNDSIASINTVGVVTGMSAGTATISFTRYNSCGLSTSATRTITVIAAKDANGNDLPESVQTYVSIYPNPVSDVLNISLPEGSEDASIILTDVTGKVVATQQANTLSQTLNLSGLAKGNYMLTITTATRKWVEKVVLE